MIHYMTVNQYGCRIVRKYIYIYAKLQIPVKYSVSQWFNVFIKKEMTY